MKTKKKTGIIFSDTWLEMTKPQIQECLQETIDDFVDEDDEIINIQLVKDSDGTSRFWIYVKYFDNEA